MRLGKHFPLLAAAIAGAALLVFAGCGGKPAMEPAARGALYSDAFKALQEIRGHTTRALDFPEYVLRLRDLDKTFEKLARNADAEARQKLDEAAAPWHAALDQWMAATQPGAGAIVADVMPLVREQWRIGWERARELKAEADTLAASAPAPAE
jgi:hypothetical protein